MKKIALLLTIILTFSLPVYASESTESSIEPRASYVFSSVASVIDRSAYGGDSILVSKGTGTITIYLQRQLSYNGSWVNVDGEKYSKSFSNTSTVSFAKSKILSTGTYRCKTYIIAYVNGNTDSRTVYSPSLTII